MDASTVAMAGVALVHVPPEEVLVQVWDDPMQTGVIPVMVCAMGSVMVTIFVPTFAHPPIVTVYVIIDVPAAIPVIMPVDDSAVAMEGALLVHAPPVVLLVQVCEDPIQIGVVPVIV